LKREGDRIAEKRFALPGPLPIIQWLLGLSLLFLVTFLVLAAIPEAREAVGGSVTNSETPNPAPSPMAIEARTPSLETTRPSALRIMVGQEAPTPATSGYQRELLRQLFLLSAAGLGACFAAL